MHIQQRVACFDIFLVLKLKHLGNIHIFQLRVVYANCTQGFLRQHGLAVIHKNNVLFTSTSSYAEYIAQYLARGLRIIDSQLPIGLGIIKNYTNGAL